MNNFSKLSEMSIDEVREFVKQKAQDESFIDEIVTFKEQAVPLLLESRALPTSAIDRIAATKEGAVFILDQLIQANYTPSNFLIEKLADHGEDLLIAAIKAFPSVPVATPFLMRLINGGLIASADLLVKQKANLKNEELLYLLCKAGTRDEEIIDLAVKSSALVFRIINEAAESTGPNFSSRIVSLAIIALSEEMNNPTILKEAHLKYGLSCDAMKRVIDHVSPSNWSFIQIIWTPEVEGMESERLDDYLVQKSSARGSVRLLDVPPHSKYRSPFLRYSPTDATDEELPGLCLAGSSQALVTLARHALSRPLSVIKQIDPEFFAEQMTPVKLADNVTGVDKALYLLEVLPSKFKTALKKKIPLDQLPSKVVARKKSYFPEAIEAISKDNVEDFRLALSGVYTLTHFVADTHTSSKQSQSERTSLREKVMACLEREEFFSMRASRIRFGNPHYYDKDSKLTLKFKLSADEAASLCNNLGEVICFDNCSDKTGLLSKCGGRECGVIFVERTSEIMEDKALFQAVASREVVGSLNEESVIALSKVLKSTEVGFIKKSLRDIERVDYLNLVCSDGIHFLSEKDVMEMMKGKYVLESENFMNKLVVRDRELARKLIEAYVEGNKGLTKLFGEEFSIRRDSSITAYFKRLLSVLDQSPEQIIDGCFDRGGNSKEFCALFLNPAPLLQEFSRGRVVTVDLLAADAYRPEGISLGQVEASPAVNYLIKVLLCPLHRISQVSELKNIKVERLSVEGLGMYGENGSASIADDISRIAPQEVAFSIDGASRKLQLKAAGLSGPGIDDAVEILNASPDEASGLGLSELKYAASNGLVFTRELVQSILEGPGMDAEGLGWLVERTGGLSGYHYEKATTGSTYNREKHALLEKFGVVGLTSAELELKSIKKALKLGGTNFEPIDVSQLSPKAKFDIIRLIEKEIDPNFVKLSLTSTNLEHLETILPYARMQGVCYSDDASIIGNLSIPSQVSSNKKIMAGIRDYLSLSGIRFTAKVMFAKVIAANLDASVELGIQDFLSYGNPQAVTESDFLSGVDSANLSATLQMLMSLKSLHTGLRIKGKSDVTRFMRSACGHDAGYVKDTGEMITAVVRGVEGMKDRAENLKAEGADIETLERMASSAESVIHRLDEILVMNDMEAIHDRLLPLLSFIKSDPNQPLGQDKFKKLESSKGVAEKLGYKLFFPKTRGDLQVMGDVHGWCVNHHRQYGDNVIRQGNILVGICEADADPSAESVVALAHYLNEGDDYTLEQLKWSKNKKQGARNVDATRDFDHARILSEITRYLDDRAAAAVARSANSQAA